MRTILTEELKKNALEYYQKGKLTAQNNGRCVLRDGNCRCVIGASMTDKEISKARGRITSVVALSYLQIVQFQDVKFASNLQRKHDLWARSQTELAKQKFLALLNA
jgi:hypothetical protein